MPKASEVIPQKWSNIKIIFEDEDYSVIMGNYDGNICLGERWNGGENGYGFPHQADKPIWHIVPSYFQIPILHKILELHLRDSSQNESQIALTIEAIGFFQKN